MPSAANRPIDTSVLARPSLARAEDVIVLAGIPEMPAAQLGDRLLKVVKRLEAPVDRGKPEIRDLVEVAERPEDRQPHLVGRHLRQAARPDRLLHPLREHGELVLVDRPALTGPLNAADDL